MALPSILLVLASFAIGVASICANEPVHQVDAADDASLDAPSMIRKHGYVCEVHEVVTVDGYILQLHRVPPRATATVRKRPVVVQHGLFASSADFVLSGPGRAFAYVLSDLGYDVWLGNSRGNRYSKRHVAYDPRDDADRYWRFSWHEMGVYDLPATIDYVLKMTGSERILHVGYSQGATAFYVMATERPQYVKKVAVHVSYAPAVYMEHMHSPIFAALARYTTALQYIAQTFNINALPPSQLLNALLSLTCSNRLMSEAICINAVHLIYGRNDKETNGTVVNAFVGHMPAGISVGQLLHYGQAVNSKRFRRYDYGPIGNWKRYRALVPPDYDFNRIGDVPIYIFASLNDWYADRRDVERLRGKLGERVKGYVLVEDESWSHLDYLLGVTAKETVYDRTVQFFEENE